MAQLEDFTKDQRDLLVALPYRVGCWISASDDTGGGDADEAELQALNVIVTGFAEDFCKSEFVQAMMEETIAREAEWAQWTHHLEDVPGECIRATDLLLERLDRKEVTSFKLTMMEIATSVAMAYREFDHSDDISHRIKIYGRVMIERLRGIITGQRARSIDEFLNISEAEQRALDSLARALDLGNTRAKSHIAQQAETA
jgi:hypothetical protein